MIHRRRTAGLALPAVVMAVLAGVLTLGGTPAGAAVSMSASPTTDLTGVTVVHVSASGLAPGASVGTGFCNGTDSACQVGAGTPVGADGTFDGIAVVTPILVPMTGANVDCRLEACKVILADFTSFTTIASVPVSFAPDANPDVPPPTVTPSSDLIDGQVVTIDVPAGNFYPGRPLKYLQCAFDVSLVDLCPWAQPTTVSTIDGTVHVTLPVSRILEMVEEPPHLDCVAVPCFVAIYDDVFPASQVVPIAFAPAPPPGLAYHPTPPTRVLDSRTGLGWSGSQAGPLLAGQPKGLTIASVSGPVPLTAAAVVLNVTVTNPTDNSYLTVWPGVGPPPQTSSLNFAAGETTANLVTVPLASFGAAFADAVGRVDVVVDVLGYFADGAYDPTYYNAWNPTRALDTRTGPSAGPIVAGAPRDLAVRGVSVPVSASSVIVNITATDATSGSYLTTWPGGTAQPTTSTSNFGPGQTVAHLTIVPLGADGSITIANAVGAVHVVVDVVGYFAATGARFHPLVPTRILDDRVGTGLTGPWHAGQSRALQVVGPAGIPISATGVVLNATATAASAPTFLRVQPQGGSVPGTSSLNVAAGATVPNLVISGLSASGQLAIYNDQGTVDVIGDVAGYFSPS